jgi:hypothetical protein
MTALLKLLPYILPAVLTLWLDQTYWRNRIEADALRLQADAHALMLKSAGEYAIVIADNGRLSSEIEYNARNAQDSLAQAHSDNRAVADRLDAAERLCAASRRRGAGRLPATNPDPQGRDQLPPVSELLVTEGQGVYGFLTDIAHDGDQADAVATACRTYAVANQAQYDKWRKAIK